MEFRRHCNAKEGLDVGMKSSTYEELKQKEYSDASKLVRLKIIEDPQLFYGYQSNIAMAFIDAEYNFRKKTGKKYLNRLDKHHIANEAAKNFIFMWCK